MGASIEGDRLLRIHEVCQMVGMSRSSVYRAMRKGTFPQSVRLGEKTVRWRNSDLDAWMRDLPSDGGSQVS